MLEIINTFTAIDSSLGIQDICPILQGSGYRIVFEGNNNNLQGDYYAHCQLYRLLKRVPLLVLERMDVLGIGATQYTPSGLQYQDPWHRDITDTSQDNSQIMKMPKGVTRSVPTYFSLEEAVRKAIQEFQESEPSRINIDSLMQFQDPFLVSLVHRQLRLRIQEYDTDFTDVTCSLIPPSQKYIQEWTTPECVTTILVRNSSDSPILHARPVAKSGNTGEKNNALILLPIDYTFREDSIFR